MKVPQLRTRSNAGNTVLQGVKRTGADFGGQLAQPVAQASQAVNEFAVKEFQAANIAAVQDAESNLYEWENNSLYGDGGLYSKKGRDAMGASDDLLKNFDEHSQKVAGNLTNDQQRRAFKQSLDARRNDLMRSSSRYQFGELQNYKANQSTAYIANSQVAAANNYQSPVRINEEIKRQTDSIRATSAANGISPENTKLQIDTAVSTTHTTVIQRMLSNQEYTSAKGYFDKNKEQLLPNQRDVLNEQINAGETIETAQVATDEIMSMGLTEKESLAYARDNYSGKERDAVVQRVKVRHSEQDQVQIFNDMAASQVAYNQILNGQEVDVVNASNLTPEVADSLNQYKQSIETGVPVVTTAENKSRLDFLYADHPGEFMKTNLLQYRGTLSDTDYNQYSELQSQMIKDAKEAQKGGKPFMPTSDFYNPKSYTARVSKNFGIYDPDKTSAKQSKEYKEYYAQFSDHVEQALIDAQRTKNEALSWEEEKNVIDNAGAFWKVNVNKLNTVWDDNDIFAASLTEKDLADGDYYVDVKGVPKETSVKLTEYLIKHKIPPTEENVMYAFQQGKHL